MLQHTFFSKTTLTYVLLLGCVVGGVLLVLSPKIFQSTTLVSLSPQRVSLGESTWQVIGIAATEHERARGLSFRDSIPEYTGLLFRFEQPGMHSFWMKDMRFPIDIIFIRNNRVDSVAKNRLPGDLTPVFPLSEIDWVLEVNAGEAATIEPGAIVTFEEEN